MACEKQSPAFPRLFESYKIGKVELRAAGHVMKRGGKASSQGTKQQLLGSPATLQTSQLGGFGEVDGVGRGLALGQSGAA